MSLRCKLGWHNVVPAAFRVHDAPTYKSFTNAVCTRCGKRIWVNWPKFVGEAGGREAPDTKEPT